MLISGLPCVVSRVFKDLLVTWAGPEPQNPSMSQPEPRRAAEKLLTGLGPSAQTAARLGLYVC